jgi:undecaprenyl diphosphate synthase
MDGNGRWAEQRGLPVAEGHREGTRALRRTVEAAIDLGVRSLAVYAFSTENWSRPADEVEALMEIFGDTIERELPDLAKQGVRTRFIGRRDRAPDASSSRRRVGCSRRASPPTRSTKSCSRRTSTRRSCPIPIC